MSRSSKGSQFERDTCRLLSLWWTAQARDDVFWRSSQSGGRATTRAKSGKRTFGQYGDISAVDPIGQPLTRALCIELKRGYTKFSFADAIDRSPRHAATVWETFIDQASHSAEASGAFAWLLIQRRDKREALVFFPRALYVQLKHAGAFSWKPSPFLMMRVRVRTRKGQHTNDIVCLSLNDFLAEITPEHICSLQLPETET